VDEFEGEIAIDVDMAGHANVVAESSADSSSTSSAPSTSAAHAQKPGHFPHEHANEDEQLAWALDESLRMSTHGEEAVWNEKEGVEAVADEGKDAEEPLYLTLAAQQKTRDVDQSSPRLESAAQMRLSLGLEPLLLPDEFLCPITCERMVDPVVASDGHSYERSAILELLSRPGPLSPLTREPLDPSVVVKNWNLKRKRTPYFQPKTHASARASASKQPWWRAPSSSPSGRSSVMQTTS
jgi:hypothetical protein